MKISKFDGFRVEIDESNLRADIVLSRPPLNVVLFSQRKVMANQFYELDKNKNIRVIVLRADGDNFSSGGNIAGFLEETPEDLSMLAQNVMTPEKIKKPAIAAIQGYCFGVGFEFSLACDFRIVTKDSQLSLPEMKIGMIPGSGGSARLAKMIGISRTKNIIMRGKRLSGEEAYQLGIACELVEKSELENVGMMGADHFETFEQISTNKQAGRPAMGVGKNCQINNAILDKNVRIGDNVVMDPTGLPDNFGPGIDVAVRDGILVVTKDTIVPDGFVLKA